MPHRDAAYLQWLRASGVQLSGVTLAQFDGTGRGVVALRTLQPGETVVSVPDGLVLMADSSVAAAALQTAGLTAEVRVSEPPQAFTR